MQFTILKEKKLDYFRYLSQKVMTSKQQKNQQKYVEPTQSSNQIEIEILPPSNDQLNTSQKPQQSINSQLHRDPSNTFTRPEIDDENHPRSDYRDLIFYSVVASLFCCCPTGMFALYFSCSGRTYYDERRYSMAYEHKKWANKCLVFTVVLGIIVWLAILALALP